MSKLNRLSHTLWNCTYHIITVPKYRFHSINAEIEADLRNQIYKLCEAKDVRVEAINIQTNHVHMALRIPPCLSVSELMGYLKGKTAIAMFKLHPKLYGRYWGRHFWARGYSA
jgi:putative transposase